MPTLWLVRRHRQGQFIDIHGAASKKVADNLCILRMRFKQIMPPVYDANAM